MKKKSDIQTFVEIVSDHFLGYSVEPVSPTSMDTDYSWHY